MNENQLLVKLLQKNFKDCKINWLETMMSGGVVGSVGENTFNITLKNDEFLLISATKKSGLLDTLKPTLIEFMGSNPICIYDHTSDEGLIRQTLEWGLLNPDDRITVLVNGKAFKYKIENIVLFGRELSDFTNDAAKKLFADAESERIKNAHIFGIYPGPLVKEDVAKMSEVDLWLSIDSFSYMIWWQRHQEGHGRIPHVDMTEHQYALEYLVYYLCKKINIEVSEPTIDEHILQSADFQKWYAFYSSHFKQILSDNDFKEFQEARKSGSDISKYLPRGNWR